MQVLVCHLWSLMQREVVAGSIICAVGGGVFWCDLSGY